MISVSLKVLEGGELLEYVAEEKQKNKLKNVVKKQENLSLIK